MTGNQPEDPEDQVLLDFLDAQRDSVLSIVEGLDEEAWHRSVVPSGWTPAGLVEHLGGAEWHWFQGVVAGADPSCRLGMWTCLPMTRRQRSSATCPQRRSSISTVTSARSSDAVLAVTPLSAPPRGRHGDPNDEPPNVRWVVLHMIEETARHAGHLDIARELIDGQTGLGPR